MNGARLACAVGRHRVEAPRVREAAAADTVTPRQHGEGGKRVAIFADTVPRPKQMQSSVWPIELPGGDAATQRRYKAQMLTGVM